MYKILVIGDVHGKIKEYEKILKKYKPEYSICVGDFGFKKEHEWHLKNVDSDTHRILFGNHDDYGYFEHKHSLGNYTYTERFGLMTVRGANSIDKQFRVEGVSWWEKEELSYQEMEEVVINYGYIKPSIMITHDCPQMVREKVFNIYDKSVTSQGLQSMLELHKPRLWIFGHHHKSITINVDDTIFKCLNELEVFEIEI